MACCAAFLGSVLHQGGLSRPGHTHVRSCLEGSIQLEGLWQEGESIKGQVLRYWGFPVRQTRRNKVAELWESSEPCCRRVCLERGQRFNEGQKARAREDEVQGSQGLVQPHPDRGFLLDVKSGVVLKVTLNHLEKQESSGDPQCSILGLFLRNSDSLI